MKNTEEEIAWKQRFETLAADVSEMISKIRIQEITNDSERFWQESELIYVSFGHDICDNEKQAQKLWGKNYDTYRIWKKAEDL
jgi:hypothetical protein